MYEQMCKCSDLFTRFGGHPMAAGLSIPEENIPAFRERINALCPCSVEQMQPKIHIDMQMPVDYVTVDLIHQFSCLAPFGKDNPRPIFADRNLRVIRMWIIGKNQNVLRLRMQSKEGVPVSAIYFGNIDAMQTYITEKFGEQALALALQGRENPVELTVVYVPKIDTYHERESVQFEIKYYR
jgi:single-stranded-DNA-specific exonuclease